MSNRTAGNATRFFALAGLPVLLASCASGSVTVADFAPPMTLRPEGPHPALQCPRGALTNEDPRLQEGFRLAMAEACRIFESTEFRQAVEASRLARKCPGFFFAPHRLISGSDIYRSLANGMPESFSVTAQPLRRSTVAVTDANSGSMSIEPWKLTAWIESDPSDRASTINTLVHEMTHLVRDVGGGSYFQDGWQWTPWCDANMLVSYSLGNQAEAQWRGTYQP